MPQHPFFIWLNVFETAGERQGLPVLQETLNTDLRKCSRFEEPSSILSVTRNESDWPTVVRQSNQSPPLSKTFSAASFPKEKISDETNPSETHQRSFVVLFSTQMLNSDSLCNHKEII